MSIAEELNRIRQAKLDLKEAINAKGGSLTVELLGDYAGAVRNLDSGVSGGVGTEFYKCTQFFNEEKVHYYASITGESEPVDFFYNGTCNGTRNFIRLEVNEDTLEIVPVTYTQDIEYTAYIYNQKTFISPSNGSCSDMLDPDYLYPDQETYNYMYVEEQSDPNGVPVIKTDKTLDAVGRSPVRTVENICSWSGNRAVFTDGIYVFEKTFTHNLSYVQGFVPEIGKIYNSDATVIVGKLLTGEITTDGLVFYDPLSVYTPTAATGQTIPGGCSGYYNYKNVPCGVVSPALELNIAYTDTMPRGNGPFTASIWLNRLGPSTNEYNIAFLMNFGKAWSDDKTALGLVLQGDESRTVWVPTVSTVQSGIDLTGFDAEIGTWHFFAATYDGSVLTAYWDGQRIAQKNMVLNIGTEDFAIGRTEGSCGFSGYISSPRVYNRALSAREIQILASEFTPTE